MAIPFPTQALMKYMGHTYSHVRVRVRVSVVGKHRLDCPGAGKDHMHCNT